MKIPRASEADEVAFFPTSFRGLNSLLGGGVPVGRLTEISGKWSVGKTTLALMLVAQAQQEGKECVWMDAEWSWDGKYSKELGVDTKKLGLVRTRTAEEGLDMLLDFLEDAERGFVVIDAVGALHPADEAQKGSGERTIGSQSALVARFLRKAIPLVSLRNHILIVLNHEYQPIMNTGGRPVTKTSGGAKLEYHKSVWLSLSRIGKWIKQGEDTVGYFVEAQVRKNKVAATEKKTAQFALMIGTGFSEAFDLLRQAVESGLVEKRGRQFWMGETKLGFEKQARAKIEDSLELQEKIKNATG